MQSDTPVSNALAVWLLPVVQRVVDDLRTAQRHFAEHEAEHAATVSDLKALYVAIERGEQVTKSDPRPEGNPASCACDDTESLCWLASCQALAARLVGTAYAPLQQSIEDVLANCRWRGDATPLPSQRRRVELQSVETLLNILGVFAEGLRQATAPIDPSGVFLAEGEAHQAVIANASAYQAKGPQAAHSEDFHSVAWFGTTYTFTPLQAKCVEVMWSAWEKGTPSLGQEYILEAAGSSQNRLSKVFDDGKHPAWRTMISSEGPKGSFRLCPPRGHENGTKTGTKTGT